MGKHIWRKKNLVTISKGGRYYDILRCENCGKEIKRFGFESPPEYGCTKDPLEKKTSGSDLRGKPLGWWGTLGSTCPRCHGIGMVVPRSGHPLSYCWVHERDDGFELICCHSGCEEL